MSKLYEILFYRVKNLNQQCLTCWQIWLARHQDLLLFQQELIIGHLTVRHYQKSSDSLDLAPLSSQPDSTFSTLSKSTWNFKNKICLYLLIKLIKKRVLQGLNVSTTKYGEILILERSQLAYSLHKRFFPLPFFRFIKQIVLKTNVILFEIIGLPKSRFGCIAIWIKS